MTIFSWFKKIIQKTNWSVIGVFIALGVGSLTIYSFFHEKKPDITIEILNESNVLDVHKPLEDLSIYFQGEDIKENNLNLRIYTLKIENTGEVDILQNYFDRNKIWGLQFNHGRIIEARLLNSNSDYIKEELKPEIMGENKIKLEQIVFDKKTFFSLEILVLHSKDKSPEIFPIGKIAGIENTILIETWRNQIKQSFLNTVFTGGVLVHIFRAFVYFFLFIVGLFVLIRVPSFITEKFIKNTRKKQIKYLYSEKESKEPFKKILIEKYIDYGIDNLLYLTSLLNNNKRLLIEYNFFESFEERLKGIKELDILKELKLEAARDSFYVGFALGPPQIYPISDRAFYNLAFSGAFKRTSENKIIISETLIVALKKLLTFLQEFGNSKTRRTINNFFKNSELSLFN